MVIKRAAVIACVGGDAGVGGGGGAAAVATAADDDGGRGGGGDGGAFGAGDDGDDDDHGHGNASGSCNTSATTNGRLSGLSQTPASPTTLSPVKSSFHGKSARHS